MKFQSDNIYCVNEDELFTFMQKFSQYLLKFEEKNCGLHPDAETRDRWMCKYAKKNFTKLR